MGADIFIGQNSNMERLIQTILQIESEPRFRYEVKKAELQKRTNIITDLDSKLSSLQAIADKLTDPLTDHFASKSVTTSDSDKISASADSSALVGNHDISVERLASSDTRVSLQYSNTGTELQSFFSSNGSQTFNIDVAHPTEADSANRESIAVTLNPTGTNNDDILKEIATAINEAMATAVIADTIDPEEKMSASVVHEYDGTSRLVFKSGLSGYTNRMAFTDSGSSLLATLEINNAVLSAGTAGGYITDIGTSSTDSLLNAKLNVDGLTFYRDGNAISDIMDGVTMNINDVTTTNENLKVAIDSESVRQQVEEYLNAYNDVIAYLKSKTGVDPDLNVRGELAGDSTYTFLRTNIRSIMTAKVEGLDSGNPQYLFNIGIETATDGSLSISDSEEFNEALASGSARVSDLFNSTNGVATQIKDFLEEFVKVGGILDDSQSSIEDRIKSLDSRVARFDARMVRREFQLRQQFAKMQETAQLLGGQSAAFASIANSAGFY
jgi:flagellar hook-associated protein 2